MSEPRYGATSSAHCLTCRATTTFAWSGVESRKPRVDVWTCRRDGRVRVQMADVTDAEALCRAILDRSGSTFPTAAEYDDAVSFLRVELWALYVQYDPARGLRFTSYATGILRLRVNDVWRNEMGRNVPKPHFGAVSLDAALADAEGVNATFDSNSHHVSESDVSGRGQGSLAGQLARAVSVGSCDPQVDSSPDLLWVLAQGGGGTVQPLPPRDSQSATAEVRQRGVDRVSDAAAA